MKRYHLMEIEDQDWCPAILRDGMTDFLQFSIETIRPYAAIVPRLAAAMARTGQSSVIDLCSGGGGPWRSLVDALGQTLARPVQVVLTDRFPNVAAFQKLSDASGGRISFRPAPVDATDLPVELSGFRTLFTSFHHFRPEQGLKILQDAVRKRQPIAIFEVTERKASMVCTMPLIGLFVLLATPFMRPFRWSRLLFTYLVPLIPFGVMFDGVVSCFRTYTPDELKEMTASLEGGDGYEWQIGVEPVPGTLGGVTYLIGVPGGR